MPHTYDLPVLEFNETMDPLRTMRLSRWRVRGGAQIREGTPLAVIDALAALSEKDYLFRVELQIWEP